MAVEVPDELRNFLRNEEMRALDTGLNEARAVALKAYQGDRYGDEEDGRSQAVTRDVSEVVDTMLVGILGTIMAGGKAVEFDTEPEEVPEVGEDGQPVMQPQQEEGAPPQPKMRKVDYGAEATAAVHYQFMRKQKGYRILHDAGKAGMLEKTGIVKTYVEPRRPIQQTVVVPQGNIDEREGEYWLGEYRIIEAAPVDELAALTDPLGADSRVTIEIPQPPVVRDVNIPNEWFMVSPDTVDLDESPYVGDKVPTTKSALVAMGLDADQLETIWSNPPEDTVIANARDTERSANRDSAGPRNGPQRVLWLNHEYPLFDLNGDGVAERLSVLRIGHHILDVMEVDEQPYSGWSPIPMQHRFTGQSMADKIMDIQRIRSVLLRQALDSIYQTTAPRTTVNVDGLTDDTLDDLLTVRPGAIIRYRGAFAPAPLQGMRDSSPTSFQAMEMMSAERESRTGVTRQSQGMNPDTTNKTASGMAMLQANADQIELYVTRNLAEGLVAPMFGKRYRLMREHVPPFKMKIEGKYTLVDPSKWPEEPDMQINVGLGTGSRDQRIAYRRELMSYQAEAMGAGLRIVTEQEAYNSIKAFVDDTALGVATDYVLDPALLPPAPEKADPAAIEAQGKVQIEAGKLEAEQQKTAGDLDLKSRAQEIDREVKLAGVQESAAIQRWEAEQRIERDNARANAEAALALDRQTFDMAMAREQADFNMELARKKASAAGDDAGTVPKLRPGGDLDK